MKSPASLNRRARWSEHALPVAFICAITVLFFTPRFFSRTYSAVGQQMFATYPWVALSAPDPGVPTRGYPQTDHAETYYPLSVFATEAWRSGELPMWLPYSFGGIPIMELGMTSLLYPPRLVLLYFFDPPRQHDLMMFLHLLVAGLGMYALMRSWGVSGAGASVAAFIWQFNGHSAFWLVIEQVAVVAAWSPLMLLAAGRAVERRSFKWATVAGAALALALYSGATHYVHLSGWLLAGWYGVDVLRAALREWRERQKRAAAIYLLLPVVSLVTALIIGLAYWLPLLSLLDDLGRQPVAFAQKLRMGASWSQLWEGMWLPRSAWNVVGTPIPGFAFTSLAAVALAIAGLTSNRTRHVRIAAVFVLLALMTVLGVQWWLTLLHFYVPFFDAMALHPAFYVFTFAIAVLAGFGVHELTQRWTTNARAAWLSAALVIVIGLVQTGLLLRPFGAIFGLSPGQWLPYLLSWRALVLAATLASIFGVAILLNRGHKAIGSRELRVFSYGVALLIAFDLSLFAWLTVPYHLASRVWFFPETPLLTGLKELQGEWRLLPVYQHTTQWTSPVLPGKTAAIFGLRSGHGYESLLPARTALLWRTVEGGGEVAAPTGMQTAYKPYFQHDRLPIALLEKLSVGLLVAPPQVEPSDPRRGRNLVADGTLRLVYQGRDGWVYENPRALERAFVVPQTIQVEGAQQALETLLSAQFDARRSALIEQPLQPDDAALLDTSAPAAVPDPAQLASTARIVRESLNEIEIATSSPRAGVLVLNDMWAKGWRATVDGAPHTVHRVNFAARGVVVPEGPHHVVFRYRPPLLLFSIGASSAALLLLAGGVCIGRHRSAGPQLENGPGGDHIDALLFIERKRRVKTSA